jgi:folate-dependent phosphoribosylglycinamide formyltransferase PurN
LHARIQQAEHRLYPKCVAAIACGEVVIQGRKVVRQASGGVR